MVKDKINYRALGPRTSLTRQPVQGRANDGGLRIGEMERDGVLGHGASYFLNESFLVRGDEYFMAVCNKTGNVAIYNPSKNLFFSPAIDGPIKFNTTVDGKQNVENLSRFGRSFSIVRVPYAMKLLMQELMVLNIQMKIITDENVDQLMSMSYSSNYKLLLNPSSENPNKIDSFGAITKYDNIISENVKDSKNKRKSPVNAKLDDESVNTPVIESPYGSDDFAEFPNDIQAVQTMEQEEKNKEEREKELLLSDIIEELSDGEESQSVPYPEDVSPAFNPNANVSPESGSGSASAAESASGSAAASDDNILEFKEETDEEKEKEKENETGDTEESGKDSTKKIII